MRVHCWPISHVQDQSVYGVIALMTSKEQTIATIHSLGAQSAIDNGCAGRKNEPDARGSVKSSVNHLGDA